MSEAKFEQWCVVELFGHQMLAGKVTDQQIGGQAFIRVDVPETKENPSFTKFYGSGAVYAMTPTDEATAKMVLEQTAPRPINIYIPARFQLPDGDPDAVPA